MAVAELSTILWRQRELLAVLQFKLEEEQLLLASGRSRWLAQATREVELVLAQISAVEETRAVEVEQVARAWGLPPTASLAALADAAPPPWDAVLHEHRTAFLACTAEISGVAQLNRELLQRGYQAISDTMRAVAGVEQDGYGADGRPASTTGRRHLVDGRV